MSTRTFDVPTETATPRSSAPGATNGRVVLMVAWCVETPQRVGEIIDPDTRTCRLGRGYDGTDAATLIRRRPHGDETQGPLRDPHISRNQLYITRVGDTRFELKPGRPLIHVNGVHANGPVTVGEGHVINVRDRLLLTVVRIKPVSTVPDEPLHRFGEPDGFGIVGESHQAWTLRRQIRNWASLDDHVLILGDTGVGKELVAEGLHRASSRRDGPWVARSAATIPEGLIEAELFGNRKNYPHQGMEERNGLFAEAHEGTLFLDEIGELPEAMQSRLLRVLDAKGEYHRLGESKARRSNFRMVAATNRAPTELKHDLQPRFDLHFRVPNLAERPADIPLLVRYLARKRRDRHPDAFDASGEPRIGCKLVEALLRSPLPGNVRQVRQVLVRALANAEPNELATVPRDAFGLLAEAPANPLDSRDPKSITADEVEAALAANPTKEAAARALGLRNRHQLQRLRRRLEQEDRP